ncbi:MAG: heparan-alpha-glucosaminide N-acetyltransferase [Candidatus Thermoplasmatota archaeon]|nr:heparan-alpha-glucosaminide N-acetyltransferase [Candidatus Thermoplasmatota archaeon]
MELDMLRGFAIIIMIFLHLLWDLDYFGLMPLNKQIYRIQPAIPTVFFLLVGMCMIVSRNRKNDLSKTEQKKYDLHLIIRGLKIFGLGMILTIATIIFIPDRPIIFGVLHCIGICIILSTIFLKIKPTYNLIISTILMTLSYFTARYPIENPNLLHIAIGLHQTNIGQYTIDYFPLIPWLGVCILGISLGSWLYKDNKRRFHIPDLSKYTPVKIFSWLGKHSLGIYLAHQPIIAGIILMYIRL